MGKAASKKQTASERQNEGQEEQPSTSESHKRNKKKSKRRQRRKTSIESSSSSNSRENMFSKVISCSSVSSGVRRTKIPDRPDSSSSVWSLLKNNLGKDLATIPFPVNFSEPLSMLQRLTENYEYSYLLDKAAECGDELEQLAYLGAFTVSCYSSTAERASKPFNPLLGETYECDRREDLGWRAISEQVSHHPPVTAQYCEGKSWTCWQDFSMTTKFKGRSLIAFPQGLHHCEFKTSKRHYSWNKVNTTINNIIIGKLWIDQEGEAGIVNSISGCKCKLTYFPYSIFSSEDNRKVTGCVTDQTGSTQWLIQGYWDDYIEIAPVIAKEGTAKNPILQTGPYKSVWKINKPPPDNEKSYHFTYFACQLNELEKGIAPTDSRLRPDQRLMEDGHWPEANHVKTVLEEKQRARKKLRESQLNLQTSSSSSGAALYPSEPIWFRRHLDPLTKRNIYIYKGGYWESKANQDWSMCPNIFSV